MRANSSPFHGALIRDRDHASSRTGRPDVAEPAARRRRREHTVLRSTFTVDVSMAPMLAQLKPGERVKVGYVGSGTHLTAKSITAAGAK